MNEKDIIKKLHLKRSITNYLQALKIISMYINYVRQHLLNGYEFEIKPLGYLAIFKIEMTPEYIRKVLKFPKHVAKMGILYKPLFNKGIVKDILYDFVASKHFIYKIVDYIKSTGTEYRIV